MSRIGDEPVELCGRIKGQTMKCYFFESDFHPAGAEDWAIPKSQVIGQPDFCSPGDSAYCKINVKKWLVDQNGWE